MFKITERSVYEPISSFLETKLKVKSVSEIRLEKGFIDIFFQINSFPFIAEIKLGKGKLAKAIAQAWEYASQRGTRNVIALVFPKIESGQSIFDIEKFKQQILNQHVEGYIHTDYWDEWIESRALSDVFLELYKRFTEKIRKIDFNSIVKAIREIVQDLYEVIRQANTEEIFEEIAEKLELFAGLGEIKDGQKAESQVSMLASYLLFNQLLFHHIYKIKTQDKRLEELKPIKSLKELKKYFSQITSIDYQPIYAINLIDKIPEKPEIIELINDAIKNLLVMRTEHITQDLAGRFFHALLPKEVAKVWAAFYTSPAAAEMLAKLAIDRWDEIILDPACGSGTLLAACYRRKLELYEEQTGKKLDEKTLAKLHKKFIEEDITGIDIMPFAAHLTTINLTAQKLEQTTNLVRVANMDSLELAPKASTQEFKEKGILLKPFIEKAQLTLTGEKITLKKDRTISPEGIGREFYIKPVDIVIMNPPFSDREKLPKDYLKKLNKMDDLGKICGHQINLWGYFLALAELMLKPNGKVALVAPINIARGKATEKIRSHLLDNYHIKYIIKATKDLAFSESAAFRDILLVAEKRKLKKEDLTAIVFLKKSIKEISLENVNEIVKKIKNLEIEKKGYESDEFSIEFINYNEIRERKNNLMLYLGGINLGNMDIFRNFINLFVNKGKNKLFNLEANLMKEGITSPKGLGQLVYITNPLDEKRIEKAFLIMEKIKKDLIVKIKGTKISLIIPKECTKPALRTLTGIKNIDVSNKHDYVIHKEYKNFETTLRLSTWKGKFNWKIIKEKIERLGYSRLVIPDKINLSSPNTFILSAYSEEPLILSNLFFTYNNLEREICKILSLSLNSILTLSQFITFKSETLGAYIRLSANDWNLTFQIDPTKINKSERQILLDLFDRLKYVNFPSIMEQLEKRFWARVELDKTILKILGFSDKEVEEWLPIIYDVIVEELKAMKEVR